MKLRKWILTSVLCGMLAGCNNPWSSGDRVLVSKCAYDNGFTRPNRFQVVVFKYPRAPMDNNTPKNYIKRLLGLPGELLAIFFGRIYRWAPPENAPPPFDDFKDATVDAKELWNKDKGYMHIDDKTSRDWFEEGKYSIVRKPPHIMLAMRRIVYDNDFQAKDLKGKLDRWNPSPQSAWKADGATGFVHQGKANGEVDWLRYQHLVLVRTEPVVAGAGEVAPKLITDTMAYNSVKTARLEKGRLVNGAITDRTPEHPHWVGDLMIECNVEVVEAKGEFYFELNKGIYRYQARWDLASGQCSLKRIETDGKEKDLTPIDLGSQPTSVKSPGKYMLRFSNIDARLTVWVDRALPFGDGKEYDPPEIRGKHEEKLNPEDIEARRGPRDNDVKRPASIGSKGAHVKVTHVRLWRDTYYTTSPRLRADGSNEPDYDGNPASWTDEKDWDLFRKQRFITMYVQPGHYLCLGDNSQASSDSRDWGLVPERLMLGRALVVYFPLDRIGPIR
jgi:signal peptidase I